MQRVAGTARSDLAVPAIAIAEMFYGVEKSARPDQNRDRLHTFLGPLRLVQFDLRAAAQYGRIRLHLEQSGKPIGLMDMLIAATALAHDAILVTHNVGEFSRVPGLRYEDWTIPT